MSEGLSPGETVIMDSGRWPTSYAKSLMVTVNGRLYLTNMHMIFLPSRFQSFTALLRKEEKDVVQIPLSRITEVEKGFMARRIPEYMANIYQSRLKLKST